MTCHNISLKEYLKDPCGTSSIAFWKLAKTNLPTNIKIVHNRDFNISDLTLYTDQQFFRLIHDLEVIHTPIISDNYEFVCVNTETQLELVAEIISNCYDDINVNSKQVYEWTTQPVFDNDLWIFIIDKSLKYPVALGIADFDSSIKEGSLEWIQVLPKFRGQGIGAALVNELLLRLKYKANFVTVSGNVDNKSNPDTLYRKCGFKGNDIWHILYSKNLLI